MANTEITEIVAEGVGIDYGEMADADALLKDGAEGEFRFFVEHAPEPSELEALEESLLSQGVVLTDHISYDSGIIVVRYRKTAAPPSGTPSVGIVWFIPVIAAGVLAITGSIFGWQLATKVKNILINPWLIGAIAAVAIAYFYFNRPKPVIIREGYER